MKMIKTFIISDEIFQGYKLLLDPMLFDSIKSLIEHVKDNIKALLIINNFEILIKKINKIDLHIHEYKFITDIQKSDNNIIYICSHSHT